MPVEERGWGQKAAGELGLLPRKRPSACDGGAMGMGRVGTGALRLPWGPGPPHLGDRQREGKGAQEEVIVKGQGGKAGEC